MSRRVRIARAVSHERIDDEVIAIDLETGAYFAFDGPAADCWTVADDGGSVDDMVAVLTTRYEVEAATAAVDAAAFVAALVEHGLAHDETEPGSSPVPAHAPEARATRSPYIAPAVEPYDDLETLLLIDPIHEVDDAGWPLPVTDDAT
jgi:hypothetical protein